MNNVKMVYFEQEDILHLIIADGLESGSIELTPYITIELNERNEIIGIEILQARQFIRDVIVGSLKLPDLPTAYILPYGVNVTLPVSQAMAV